MLATAVVAAAAVVANYCTTTDDYLETVTGIKYCPPLQTAVTSILTIIKSLWLRILLCQSLLLLGHWS